MSRSVYILFSLGIFFSNCGDNPSVSKFGSSISKEGTTELLVSEDENGEAIHIGSVNDPALITHVVKPGHRPYLHPIKSPDGQGVLTEFSPSHHKHQTGIYWGFTRVNGRDYFHHPEGAYWQKVGASIVKAAGKEVRWQTIYNLLDEAGEVTMQETQIWSAQAKDGKYFLDLEWRGLANEDITIEQYEYGGLFVRMPWKEGMAGEVMNAARQKNERAEGQKAMWVDVGMQLEGRSDWAHIAVLDHPHNAGFPQTWRSITSWVWVSEI